MFSWTPAFVLPEMGTLEFDFVDVSAKQTPKSEALNAQQLAALNDWFTSKLDELNETP